MKATEELKKEHRAVETAMQILDEICNKIEQDQAIEVKHLEDLLSFIRIFTDKCHHGKEEDLLFPALEAAGVPSEGGPIGVMLQEHDTMRDYIREFADALERYKSGESEAKNDIVTNVRQYLTWLSGHIHKEDNILFAMADAHLSESQQNNLYEQFEELEEERIGKGVHEEFHEMLHSLKKIYLEKSYSENGEETELLDVTKIPPRNRHPLIFQKFEELQSGETFVLENDHDPKPLLYQFKIEQAGEFSWEYLQEGPEIWQVRIGRN